MLSDYLSLCAPDAAFLQIASLNLPVTAVHAEQGYSEIIETIPDIRQNAEFLAEKNSSRRSIRRFILGLPRRQRRIAIAFYWLEWPQKKIAAYFDVTPSAVSQSLQKIRETGRKKLAFN